MRGHDEGGTDRAGHGPVVVVTRDEGPDGPFASALETRGAEVLPLPTISIEPPRDFSSLDRALASLEEYDWILFTSPHAVEAALGRPEWDRARARSLPRLRVAAIGRATAAVLARGGVTVDLVPEEAGAAGLAEALARTSVDDPTVTRPERTGSAKGRALAGARLSLAGVRVLWPRSDIARRELGDALRSAGAELTDPVVYRTVPAVSGGHPGSSEEAGLFEGLRRRLLAGEIDAVSFMSPSSAQGLASALGAADLSLLAGRTVIASIGPTTSAALAELGAPAEVESSARTADDLAETLMSYLRAREGVSR